MVQRQVTSRGVVTPEAVPLEFQAAGIGSRCVALLLDLMIQGTVILTIVLAVVLAADAGVAAGLPEWIGVTLVLVLIFAVLFGYPTALETLWRGRTVGKAALGLRVVTREGAPVRFRHAAIRAALGLIDFQLTLGAAAVISSLLSRRHQRLGDLVAGTIVLRERAAERAAEAVRFRVPPGGEAYAATLDPAVLSAHDYQAVRAFLLRAHTLRPPVRADIARAIAQPLAERLSHRPPGGVSPETFLVCMAARYQQRTAPAPHGPAAPVDLPAPPR